MAERNLFYEALLPVLDYLNLEERVRDDARVLTPASLNHVIALLVQHWNMHRQPGVIATGCYLFPEVACPEYFRKVELKCLRIQSPLCRMCVTPRDLLEHYRAHDRCPPGYTIGCRHDVNDRRVFDIFLMCTRCKKEVKWLSISKHEAWHHQWDPHFRGLAWPFLECRKCFNSYRCDALENHMKMHAQFDGHFTFPGCSNDPVVKCRKCAWSYRGAETDYMMKGHTYLHEKFGSAFIYAVPSERWHSTHVVKCAKCDFSAEFDILISSRHIAMFQEHAALHKRFDSDFVVTTLSLSPYGSGPSILQCRMCGQSHFSPEQAYLHTHVRAR